MPSATTLGYPYPLGNDPINDGDNQLLALATAIDVQLAKSAHGYATIPIVAAATAASVSVTYPVGLFAEAGPTCLILTPNVTAAPALTVYVCATAGLTTGATIWGSRSGGNTPFDVMWEAVAT